MRAGTSRASEEADTARAKVQRWDLREARAVARNEQGESGGTTGGRPEKWRGRGHGASWGLTFSPRTLAFNL